MKTGKILAAALALTLVISNTAMAFPSHRRHFPRRLHRHRLEHHMPPRLPHYPQPLMSQQQREDTYNNSYDNSNYSNNNYENTLSSTQLPRAEDTFKNAFANAAGEMAGEIAGEVLGNILGSLFSK